MGSIFRGIGDSRVPLITVLIACILNIGGDLLLVGGFGLNVAGAAIATVFAQAMSVALSLLLIRGKHLAFILRRQDIRFNGAIIGRILKLGSPVALQDLLVNITFLVIIAIANSMGTIPSAGVGVAEKLCAFVMLVPSAYMQSMSAFVAQNIGAGLETRARRALLYGVTMASGTDNYRLTRILSFINPELVDESATYQVTQSKIAIGSGGLKGVGMFVQGSFSQLDYVPEDWTDFIFSTIGEAWGFVGCAAVVIVYLLIILRMMYLARYTADRFGQMVILGVMAMLLFHVFENVGMTTGLMPVTGIPLPFLSYGGSNLVTNMGGIGLVLNVVKNRSITSMPGLAPQTRIRGKYT